MINTCHLTEELQAASPVGSTLSLWLAQTGGGICREGLKKVLHYLSCGCHHHTGRAGVYSSCWQVLEREFPNIPVCQRMFPNTQNATEELSPCSQPDACFQRRLFTPFCSRRAGEWGEQQHPQEPGESRVQRGHVQPVTADAPLQVPPLCRGQLESRLDAPNPPKWWRCTSGTCIGVPAAAADHCR